MGHETFSKAWVVPKMHPVFGTRGEFVFLGALLWAVWTWKNGRKKNEDGIRNVLGFANNTWADAGVVAARKWKN
eukprot:CAMPEP_0170491752 /NCGR_PEP_ID=MMETSP0208-20121228/11234_1 /TAXON_ID=197538 /ORGANISM="Strombidium inclinatum, Strain S3" /LENGTH=73 /DNA_ID=CAMNT_0010767377 /DNA_START=184 /DNA_END=405 /DNA_ORIENTATION=+